jgi:hypothetical protein
MVPGVVYPNGANDFWVRRCQEIWKHHQANPNGPFTYSGWDAVPGRAETRPKHARWLKEYLPLVEEGTWAWLEIGPSSLFAGPLPKDVVASAFANRELHLVLANYGRSAVEIATADGYVPSESPSAAPKKVWSLPPRSLHVLRRRA